MSDNPPFVTVEGKALRDAFKMMLYVVEARTTIPILSGVRVTYAGGKLNLAATDLDMSITTIVDEIDGDGEFDVALDARVMLSIAKLAGRENVTIEPSTKPVKTGRNFRGDDGKLVEFDTDFTFVRFGDAEYSVYHVGRPDDHPELKPAGRTDHEATFSNGSLADAIKRVMWCVSTEETRYYLNGVCVRRNAAGMRFIATDGHRLAAYRYDRDPVEKATDHIIPAKACRVIASVMAGKGVTFTLSENRVTVDSGPTVITSKLIDGTYPDVDRVIPGSTPYQIEVDRFAMIDAIQRATAVSRERGRAITLLRTPGGGMKIELKNPDLGSASVRVQATWPEGSDEAIGFNARYVSEILATCTGLVRLGMTDRGSPFTILDADRDMVRVIMPMMV